MSVAIEIAITSTSDFSVSLDDVVIVMMIDVSSLIHHELLVQAAARN